MLPRFIALCVAGVLTMAAHAADKPSGITGVYLTTRYPALTVRAGETTTIDLSLRNFNHPPQELALSVSEVATGLGDSGNEGNNLRVGLRTTIANSACCLTDRA